MACGFRIAPQSEKEGAAMNLMTFAKLPELLWKFLEQRIVKIFSFSPAST
jgi:hypothetical protein